VDVSDADLVGLARAGDAAAFRVLVERHRGLARARALRLGADPGDVDDIVQESFLQAFVALDRLRDPGRFAGWLCGIVVNVRRSRQEPAHPACPVPSPMAKKPVARRASLEATICGGSVGIIM
jgi:DNA-directed RNA polymerase specialized sigma24 family protein